jgi:hypothetical protein
MIKKFGPALAAGAAAALMLTGTASAATHHHKKPKQHTFASCSAQGGYAICTAGGTVNNPTSIWLHVRAQPKQRVTGAWDVTCSKGLGVGEKSGSFTGKADSVYTRRLPMNYKHPDQCVVSADAQLSQAGNSIHIWLAATK